MEAKERMIEKYENLKVKDCLKIAGDSNKYQIILIISMSFFRFFLGFQYYMFPYIFFEPSFECLSQGKYTPCTTQQACSNGTIYQIKSGIVYC